MPRVKLQTEKSHSFFHPKPGHYCDCAVVIGNYTDHLALKSQMIDNEMTWRFLKYIKTPLEANKLKFTQIVIAGPLNADQMEFLNWLRFLHDPTEGWLGRRRNIIIVD